jgi:hypothetical protein
MDAHLENRARRIPSRLFANLVLVEANPAYYGQ